MTDTDEKMDCNKEANEALPEPGQYNIRDIFFLTTMTAVFVVCAMPFRSLVSTAAIVTWVVLMLIEISVLVLLVRYFAKRRTKILATSGIRWGQGFVSDLKWSGWPHFKAWLYLFGIVTFSLLQNVALTLMINVTFTGGGGFSPPVLPMLCQLWMIPMYLLAMARCLCQIAWRVYPNTIEFFEHGVCYNFAKWYAWKDVELRPSEIHSERIVALFAPRPQFEMRYSESQLAIMKQIHPVQLPPDLKSKLMLKQQCTTVEIGCSSDRCR